MRKQNSIDSTTRAGYNPRRIFGDKKKGFYTRRHYDLRILSMISDDTCSKHLDMCDGLHTDHECFVYCHKRRKSYLKPEVLRVPALPSSPLPLGVCPSQVIPVTFDHNDEDEHLPAKLVRTGLALPSDIDQRPRDGADDTACRDEVLLSKEVTLKGCRSVLKPDV